MSSGSHAGTEDDDHDGDDDDDEIIGVAAAAVNAAPLCAGGDLPLG